MSSRLALLDTNIVIWLLQDSGPASLSDLLDVIEAAPAKYWVSHVTLWEIAIKKSIGKLLVPDDLPRWLANNGFGELPIIAEDVWAVKDLPLHHKDPFDRLLIAQALRTSTPIVTADQIFRNYGVQILS